MANNIYVSDAITGDGDAYRQKLAIIAAASHLTILS
jgi:hypothetical protein